MHSLVYKSICAAGLKLFTVCSKIHVQNLSILTIYKWAGLFGHRVYTKKDIIAIRLRFGITTQHTMVLILDGNSAIVRT